MLDSVESGLKTIDFRQLEQEIDRVLERPLFGGEINSDCESENLDGNGPVDDMPRYVNSNHDKCSKNDWLVLR